MEKSKSVLLYTEWAKPLQGLPLEDVGRLFYAILNYTETGNPQTFDSPAAAMAWEFIRIRLDGNLQKWDEICQKRREAGSLGGKQRQANATFAKQTVANQAVTVPVTVPVPVTVTVHVPVSLIERVKERGKRRCAPAAAHTAFCEERDDFHRFGIETDDQPRRESQGPVLLTGPAGAGGDAGPLEARRGRSRPTGKARAVGAARNPAQSREGAAGGLWVTCGNSQGPTRQGRTKPGGRLFAAGQGRRTPRAAERETRPLEGFCLPGITFPIQTTKTPHRGSKASMQGFQLRQQESNLRWGSQSPLPYRLAMAHRTARRSAKSGRTVQIIIIPCPPERTKTNLCEAHSSGSNNRFGGYYTVSAKADKNQSVRSTFLWAK